MPKEHFPVSNWDTYWNNLASLDLSDAFTQWLYPGYQQDKQWAQQMVSTQYQNEWESEEARMSRGKAAGINPYTMAEGIAGSGGHGSVASPPPSAVGSGAESLGAAANLAGQVVGAATGAAGITETLGLLDVRKQLLSNQAFESLTAGGLNRWSALSISTLLPYQQWNQVADFYNKLANYDYVSQLIDNLKAEHDNIVARYDEIIANVDLKYSEMEVNEAITAKTNEEARYWKATNECWIKNGYDRTNPVDVALMNAKVNGNSNSATAIGESIYQFQNQLKSGELDSLLERQYELSSKDALGKAYATWNERPNTIFAGLEDAAQKMRDIIKNGQKSQSEANEELRKHNGFLNAFKVFKSHLRLQKNDAYREYREAKRLMGNSAAVEAWNKYQNALKAYENCDEESYSDMLLGQF